METRREFRDLRLLIVGGKAHAAQTLRMALSIAGLSHATATADSEAALDLLRTNRFSAVFCDENAKPAEGMAFYLAARRASGVLDPIIPIFLVCTAPRRKFVESVRDKGVTDVIARPVSAATVLRKLHMALEMPRPFIKVGEFFGPDRRARARPDYVGANRRIPPERDDDKDVVLL